MARIVLKHVFFLVFSFKQCANGFDDYMKVYTVRGTRENEVVKFTVTLPKSWWLETSSSCLNSVRQTTALGWGRCPHIRQSARAACLFGCVRA